MRTFFALMIGSLLAAGVGGCTFEHNDYHDRHRYADGYYRAQRVETHYSYYPRHDGRYYRHDYYRGDRDCR